MTSFCSGLWVLLTLTGQHLLKDGEKLTVDVGTESCTVVDGQATNASLVCELGASNGGVDAKYSSDL